MERAQKYKITRMQTSKVLEIAVTVAAAFLAGRCEAPENAYVAGISFIAYMLSKGALNIYLVVPLLLGMASCYVRGCDVAAYAVAVCACSLVFIVFRRVETELWQRAVIAAAVGMSAVNIFRLLTSTVYRTSMADILLQAAFTVILVFLIDSFCTVIGYRSENHLIKPTWQMLVTGFVVISIMLIGAMGAMFLLWPYIVFVTIWIVVCDDAGHAVFAAVICGIAAAIIGHQEWGFTVTLAIAASLTYISGTKNALIRVLIFTAISWLLGYVQNGIVLGVDTYCLLLSAILFVLVYGKFSRKMQDFIAAFSVSGIRRDDKETEYMLDEILKRKSKHMAELTELYSSYVDNRMIIANQFNITRQIIDDIRWQAENKSRKKRSYIDVKVASSQCAAYGTINGDCFGWQEIGKGRIALIISDGMGKGKRAATESYMVSRTMLELLSSGVSVDLALKMINSIMIMKDEEDFYATLDMVIIDKPAEKAMFYKIGAAPTILRRGGNVEEVKLAAAPLGIVNGIKVKYVEVEIKKGDWIIMMSDGVSDGGFRRGKEDLVYFDELKKLVGDVRSQDPQTMCDLMLNKAADSYIGRERDDLTVVVARIL